MKLGKGKKGLTPEKASGMIRDLVDTNLARDAAHAVEQHPELEIGMQLFEEGSTKPKSRGSGAVAKPRPTW